MLNALDLFSGIGGLAVALSEWVRPIAYCEIDPYCQGVLLSRMDNSEISRSPIWTDIRIFDGHLFSGCIDIIYGRFPCQDISIAGRGKGLEGERSGLFFEIVRLAKEIKPKFIFLENVPAITSRGGLQVVREITEMGYDCRWCVISAASVGALHRRERWFLLANALQSRGGKNLRTAYGDETENGAQHLFKSIGFCGYVRNSPSKKCNGLPRREERGQPAIRICGEYDSVDQWREAVSSVRRTANGVPQRVDRLRTLGNAVVPQQAKEAFKILMGIK